MSNYKETPGLPEIAFCHERQRLLDEFLAAVEQLVSLQNEQTQALIEGNPDFGRFNLSIQLLTERKQEAKYALMAHIGLHNCEGAP
jgi:hypothetical protein